MTKQPAPPPPSSPESQARRYPVAYTPPVRLQLRNLDFAQKLLVFVILATVGFGYLGALANLFAQHSGQDGVSTITLDEIPSFVREKGIGALFEEIHKSMGVQDAIKVYHGSGAGVTELESALNGTMKGMVLISMVGDQKPDPEEEKIANSLNQMLIQWSKLPESLRRQAYEEGIPTNDDGDPEMDRFVKLFGSPIPDEATKKEAEDVELVPLISDTFTDSCVRCHSPGSPDPQAKKIPLTTFDEVNAFCVEDHGMPLKQLALTTHVHLLGFSVLFALTGFIFSLTSYPSFIRILFTPWTLLFQLMEIACWWLAKVDIIFAYGIVYLGALVGIGLLIQVFGSLLDLLFRRKDRPPLSVGGAIR